MSTPRNPILIGQAEVIDLLLPEVRTMLQRQGIYLASDSARPGFTVPLVVNADGVWSMEIDGRLDPERFHKTVRISGPFFAPGEEIPAPTLAEVETVAAPEVVSSTVETTTAAPQEALALIVDALKYGRPMARSFPEARRRHADALAAAEAMFAGAAPISTASRIDPADPWRGLYAPELMPKLDGVKVWHAAHPDLPEWPDEEERSIGPLIVAQGFAFAVVSGEYPDDDYAADEPDACAWLASWRPEPPAGDHWRLAMIHDTEDGPAAVFVRPLALIDAQERAFLQTVERLEFDAPMDAVARPTSGGDAVDHAGAALAHLSNALDDLQYSPDQRPVPLIREAMWHVQQVQATSPEVAS